VRSPRVQVQAESGLDFPHALRAIRRRDPDIIMIGEIRDLETARIAIQSSLTGHLVLSTVDINSAAATIAPLVDIGVKNYLLASTAKGVVAQQRARKLCRHRAHRHNRAKYCALELARTVPDVETCDRTIVLKPGGCTECSGIGFCGRSTIAEILPIDEVFLVRRTCRLAMRARLLASAIGAAKAWQGLARLGKINDS
jgi:general secretion pathway protein E